MKNHCLAKSIADAGWYSLKWKIRYKSQFQGKHFLECGRRDPTTKACDCGHMQHLTLGDRSWVCDACGVTHDRDLHAAKNIVFFALKKLAIVGPSTITDADQSVSDHEERIRSA